jgi:lipopolysaccharide export system protein LptA
MKRLLLFCLLAGSCGFVWAQTNLPAKKPAATQATELSSEHLYYDGDARQLVYYGHVWVTNEQGNLTCERLTISLPPGNDQHPTNVVAETNVVIDTQDEKGQPKHITGDKAVYAYSVVNLVTNETITLTGHAKYEDAQVWQTGEPMIWDCVRHHLDIANPETHIKPSAKTGDGTNSSLPNFFK